MLHCEIFDNLQMHTYIYTHDTYAYTYIKHILQKQQAEGLKSDQSMQCRPQIIHQI